MGMVSQEESVKESIDEQVDDLSDLDELDEEIPEVEVESEDEDVDEPVVSSTYEDWRVKYKAAKVAKEETRKQYENVKRFREDAERSLLKTRDMIGSANDTYKSLDSEELSYRLRLAVEDKHLRDTYSNEVREYINFLEWEEFLKFVLSTSIFDDGGIIYEVNDHIKFVLKLERS